MFFKNAGKTRPTQETGLFLNALKILHQRSWKNIENRKGRNECVEEKEVKEDVQHSIRSKNAGGRTVKDAKKKPTKGGDGCKSPLDPNEGVKEDEKIKEWGAPKAKKKNMRENDLIRKKSKGKRLKNNNKKGEGSIKERGHNGCRWANDCQQEK